MSNTDWIALADIIKDFIIGIAWPAIVIALAIAFRRELKGTLNNIASRFQFASSIELPGGIKAIFSEERVKAIDRKARQVTEKISAGIDSSKIPDLENKVKSAIVEQELADDILYLIVAQGTLSKQRLYGYLSSHGEQISLKQIDQVLEILTQESLITVENGKLKATEKGVLTSRAQRASI